jgi:hypothetical protein
MKKGFTTHAENHRFMEFIAGLVFGILMSVAVVSVLLMVTFSMAKEVVQ